MGKLDFCPYDGKKIDPNNLAYEVICADGWDWNRVRNETVISNKIRSYKMMFHVRKILSLWTESSM